MDIKKYYLGEFIQYDKHQSSYFNLPASLAVLIIFLLPGFLGLFTSIFTYCSVLIYFIIGAFEKKSQMVKIYCLQFSLYSVFCNIFLTIIGLISKIIPVFLLVSAFLSVFVAFLSIFVYLYSLLRAFQYKAWKMPFISEIIFKYFIR